MEKNAWITFHGSQTVDGHTERYELATEGSFLQRNGKYYVTYPGSEITGYKDTTTTMKIKEGFISMIRFGKDGQNTQLVFAEDKDYHGAYYTPFGKLSVGVTTKKMSVDVDQNGGEVQLDYFISMNDTRAVHNTLRVNIRKVENR